MPNEKRLEMLEQLTSNGKGDSFAWYGLALEYRSMGRIDDALRTFETLREKDPKYVAMYLMCGTMLQEANKSRAAREWLEAGVIAARESGNTHALSELSEALGQIVPPASTT